MPWSKEDLERVKDAFAAFCETIAALRDPETGCPWDLSQDFQTLRRYMLEEAYESAESVTSNNHAHFCEELGDVLLQVVLNSQIATDQKIFGLLDVIQQIDKKIKIRHPHVFASQEPTISKEEVLRQWEIQKERERQSKGELKTKGAFAGLETVFPASRQAFAIGKQAARIRFDWDKPEAVLSALKSEIDELSDALASTKKEDIAKELGDVYFCLAQLSRHLGIDPEVGAFDGNQKFLRRFAQMEKLLETDGLTLKDMNVQKMEEYWIKAKKLELKPKT